MKPTSANKLKLLVLAILFAAPVVLSVVLFRMDWRPQRMTNYGELVQPPRPISNVPLKTIDGKPVRFQDLQKKWLMVYFLDGDCGPECESSLYKMRQVHAAQGAESDRVQRVLIAGQAPTAARLERLADHYQGMMILSGDSASLRALKAQFTGANGKPSPAAIYLVDPLGNWMMTYSPTADPSGMRKDLSRLLRLSKVG